MINIFMLLLPMSLFAQSRPTCPSESFLIEYRSPTTKGMKYTCAYLKNGQTVKHGEEWTLDAQDQVASKVNYTHGEASAMPVAPPPVANDDEEKKILKSLTDFLKILSFQKHGSAFSKFKVENCDQDSLAWLKAALTKTPLRRSYSFNDRCDVAGEFNAKFSEEFPIEMKLRNLDDLDSTKLKVIMNFELRPGAVLYKFEVIDGTLSSPTKKARFNAKYQIEINPLTGEPAKNSQLGELNLVEVNGKAVKASVPLIYD